MDISQRFEGTLQQSWIFLRLAVFAACAIVSGPIHAQSPVCDSFKEWWSRPGQIRGGKLIRLGGYFYAGRIDAEWIGRNFDLVDLNAKNDTKIVASLRAANPNIAVYQQFLSHQAALRQSGAQAIQVPDEQAVQSWRLRRKDGTLASSPRGPSYLPMDFRGSSGWAEFFSREVRAKLDLTGSDGIVLDEVPLKIGFMTWNNLADYRTDDDVQNAVVKWLGDVRAALHAPVLINAGGLHGRDSRGVVLWDKFDRAIDGAWHEGWVRYYDAHDSPHDGDSWEADIGSLERFSAQGRPYIASAAFRDRGELEYGVANYLLAIKGPSGVFQPMWRYDPATRGGFNLDIVRREVEGNRDLFDVDLGCPLGDRSRNKGLWYRSFERGLVLVNSTRNPLVASVPAGYRQLSGASQPLQFKVDPFTAVILVR